MRNSWSNVHQGCLRRAKKDTKFRRTLEKQGKPLLTDLRSQPDEELVRKLSQLGIDLDRAKLRALAEKDFLAEDIVRGLEADGLALKGPEQQWAWLCLVVLWERWLPDRPCFETLDDWMQEGYTRSMALDPVGACTIWLEVWRQLLRLADERQLRSFDEFDELFPGTQIFINWVQDLELELHNAGVDETRFHKARVDFCQAYLKRFATFDASITQHTRRALAEAHFILGHRTVAERLFEEWLAADPRWGFGWIGWADCWSHWGKDENRAKAILRRGYSVEGVTDRDAFEERLEHLGVETKRNPPTSPSIPVRSGKKVGRNAPCPCGSGKKYKKCCLRKG